MPNINITDESINFTITLISYIFFFGGLLFLLRKEIIQLYRWQQNRKLLKSTKIKIKKKESRVNKSIRFLIVATFKNENKISVSQFKIITLAIFTFFMIICMKHLSIFYALLISLMMALIPYLFLRLRLMQIRSKSSGEAEILLSELVSKYRQKSGNIEETIETILSSKSVKATKPLLAKLLIKLRTTRTDNEILEATNIFAYSIGTNWALMLASNIYQTSKFGIDISLSLEDVLIQLREAKILKEERLRNISEPKRMMYFIPFSYIFLAFISVSMIGMDIEDFINNQFNTEEGLILFCLITLGGIISYLIISLVYSKKLDF